MTIIEVRDLVKKYGDHRAVDGVDFSVEEGEIFGLLGPNGAGKTTTVECIEGLRRADGGTIRVDGIDPQRDRQELAQRLGAQLQDTQLPGKLTVGETMQLYSCFYRRPRDWKELLDTLGLTEKTHTRFHKLSGGQKQRLSIALALIGNPKVAVLDELTTGLDPQNRRDVWELIERIRNQGVTILLVTHFMEEAQKLCDRLAVIDAGKVVAVNTPSGLVSEMDSRQRLRFRPSRPVNSALLTALAEVHSVSHEGNQLVITGTGDLLFAVTAALAREQITAADLRIEQASLDDAFVALTGRRIES